MLPEPLGKGTTDKISRLFHSAHFQIDPLLLFIRFPSSLTQYTFYLRISLYNNFPPQFLQCSTFQISSYMFLAKFLWFVR